MRLLLVEDSRRLQDTLVEGLRRCGHAVDAAGTVENAINNLIANTYDVAILDLRLPDGDGLEVLDHIRAGALDTHVLILTARDTTHDRVVGLRAGADDYLIKPFSFDELVARVEALFRRSMGRRDPVLRIGDLEVNTAARRVTRAGAELDLTGREYALLEYLAFRAGEIVTRGDLDRHLYDAESSPTSNAIDRLVCSLRSKLAEAGEEALIHTRRGIGYILGAAEA